MRDTLPPLASLHAFVLVAETGSLTTAADRLNVTQPAISKRIRALEAHLGTGLVHRGANSVSLTEAGRDYAAALGEAFAAIRGATSAIGARPEGPLRIRAYTTWALRWLIPRLPRFRARHPGQEVEVTTSIAPVDFARDPVDAAIRSADHPPAPGAERLQVVDVAPYAAPPLARAARRLGLSGLTLLGSRVRPGDWEVWASATGHRLPGVPLLFESTSLAVQAALEGLGAVIVSPMLVAEDVRRRRLLPIAPGVVDTVDSYWLVMPPGRPRPALQAFRAWLLEEIAHDLSGGG
ncbi:LysR family transcriptional regulator [Belnapia sp. T6]|uniref:LysR family transcriptional regulator n=1 Tax=Belnapia mucosa TaxID=2804532 RepID=A0ABS1V369_9PROT|nr:LysR family transcriptional regulator [Belnapia mucosa]MBL6456118.1 LysR family transcriptional regulator [Belnapia mucosa]